MKASPDTQRCRRSMRLSVKRYVRSVLAGIAVNLWANDTWFLSPTQEFFCSRTKARILKIKEAQPWDSEMFTQTFAQEIRARLLVRRFIHVALVRFELRIDFSSHGVELHVANHSANRIVQHPVNAGQRLLKLPSVRLGGVFIFITNFDE